MTRDVGEGVGRYSVVAAPCTFVSARGRPESSRSLALRSILDDETTLTELVTMAQRIAAGLGRDDSRRRLLALAIARRDRVLLESLLKNWGRFR